MPAALPAASAAPLGIFAAAFLAGALANLAVRSLWDWLNSRGKEAPSGSWVENEAFFASGTTVWVTVRYGGATSALKGCFFQPWNDQPAIPFSEATAAEVQRTNVVRIRSEGEKVIANYVCSGGSYGEQTRRVIATLANGTESTIFTATWPSGDRAGIRYSLGECYKKITGVSIRTAAGPLLPPSGDRFPYEPGPLPELEPEPAAPPQRRRPFAPTIAPPIPAGDPLAPSPPADPASDPAPYAPGTGTGTRADPNRQLVPLILPLLIPSPAPFDPTAPQVGNGTVTVQPLPPTVPQTDPGTEVTPDGVIGQPGTAPPATMEGIAAEVGRIEQKTRQLLNRPAPELDLGAITDLIQLLLTLLQQIYGPGSYELAPVCEEGAPAVVSWGGGVGAFGQVNVKLDALADLLQAHKDMRQPICRQKASGENVTVIFEEL